MLAFLGNDFLSYTKVRFQRLISTIDMVSAHTTQVPNIFIRQPIRQADWRKYDSAEQPRIKGYY